MVIKLNVLESFSRIISGRALFLCQKIKHYGSLKKYAFDSALEVSLKGRLIFPHFMGR